MNKKKLAVLLSKIKTFQNADIALEQYQTHSEIAADSLWIIHMENSIVGKTIADLGCGTGIFGLGALILGAKKVYFVDIDKKAIDIAKENLSFLENELNKKFKAKFFNINVKDFNEKVDVVIQNPPFGVKKSHTDKIFLLKAMEISNKIFSFHKIVTKDFVETFSRENGFEPKLIKKYKFPLERKAWFHRKKVYYVDVGFWKIEKFKR